MTKEPDLKLNVVIAYDDHRAYKRAIRTLVRVASQLGDDVSVLPMPWRFEYLGKPDWCALATADVTKAEMLVVSTSSEDKLPRAIESWIETSLEIKRNSSTAVVALLGAPDDLDGSDSPRFQFLARTTREAGLDFFAPLSPVAEPAPTLLPPGEK